MAKKQKHTHKTPQGHLTHSHKGGRKPHKHEDVNTEGLTTLHHSSEEQKLKYVPWTCTYNLVN